MCCMHKKAKTVQNNLAVTFKLQLSEMFGLILSHQQIATSVPLVGLFNCIGLLRLV